MLNFYLFLLQQLLVVSVSAFTSLVCALIGITSSSVVNICAITTGIKNFKSVMKKKKNKHDKIVLLWKSKLHTIEVLT